MKQFTFILFCLFALSCGNSKKASENNAENEEKSTEQTVKKCILTQNWNEYKDSDPYNILSAKVSGNIMTLDVSYSGGCEKHNFDLIGSAFIMKSLPPKRGIKLYHKSNNDSCRELVRETISFDITDFAYVNGEIILNLEHYTESISYTMK